MYDYFKIACAVAKVSVGDVAANVDCICRKIDEASKRNADLAVFPELSLTGCSCADLFNQKLLVDAAAEGIAAVCKYTKKLSITVVLGAPVMINSKLYDCAVVINGGKVIGLVPKAADWDVSGINWERWFTSANELDVSEVQTEDIGLSALGSYPVLVGQDLLFNLSSAKVGVVFGNDLSMPMQQSAQLSLGGAEIIVNLAARAEIAANREKCKLSVTEQSYRLVCAYAYCSAGVGESTSDCVFSGHSLIAEKGAVLAESENSLDTDYILINDIDLAKIRADRVKAFKGASKAPVREVKAEKSVLKSTGEDYAVRKLVFVPDNEDELKLRCNDILDIQVAGLKRRLEITGSKAVIGVSGGLDSTLALLVSVEAMRKLGRSAADVIGVTMPSFGTTNRTYNNALELMKKLGISTREINIKAACEQHCADIGHSVDKFDITMENIQARERTQVLMDCASMEGGFVVGTGDLSELALGWCTYNGDHMSMYSVNAGVPKTLISRLIKAVAERAHFADCKQVLYDIIDTPISPELLPPDEKGKIAQETENIVGPYALHDFYLYYMLRYGFEPEKIYTLAVKAFADEYDSQTVLKWLRVFYKRFFTQQFKRDCLPDSMKVGSVSLSPRGDFSMPSDACASLWLKQLDNIK